MNIERMLFCLLQIMNCTHSYLVMLLHEILAVVRTVLPKMLDCFFKCFLMSSFAINRCPDCTWRADIVQYVCVSVRTWIGVR